MLCSKPMLLVATAALAAAVSGGVAAANASTGTTGTTGATGTTGTTGTTGATVATATPATIIVNGAGFATIDPNASSATMQAEYLTALQGALADAHTKASALAGEVGDTLGVVQNVTEQSNDTGCRGPIMYAQGTAKSAPAGAPTPAPKPSRHHSKPKRSAAQMVITTMPPTPSSCTLEADVTVTYSMS